MAASKDDTLNLALWMQASLVAEQKIRESHSSGRANLLAQHYLYICWAANNYTWLVACEYDIVQRKLMAGNHAHNMSTLNMIVLQNAAMSVKAQQPEKQYLAREASAGLPTKCA